MDDNEYNLLDFITEDEFNSLSERFEYETGKEAEYANDLLEVTDEADMDILGLRLEESLQLDKTAALVQPLVDTMASEIYAEMQKDAGFADVLRKGATHLKGQAPAYTIGSLAGLGALKQNSINKQTANSSNALAHMMATETSADIATDNLFNKRDGEQRAFSGDNRKAIMLLAQALKSQGGSPSGIKQASFANLAGKVKGAFSAAKAKGKAGLDASKKGASFVKNKGAAGYKGAKGLAGKKGVQIGAAGAAGLGAGYAGGKAMKKEAGFREAVDAQVRKRKNS
jgi:hypothetical protein